MFLPMSRDHGLPLGGRCVLANFFKRVFFKESYPQKRSSSATFRSKKAVGEDSAWSLA